jgi:hypothetical protein
MTKDQQESRVTIIAHVVVNVVTTTMMMMIAVSVVEIAANVVRAVVGEAADRVSTALKADASTIRMSIPCVATSVNSHVKSSVLAIWRCYPTSPAETNETGGVRIVY